jgi:glycosyltransferase involved in cell wall biosynthesis
VAADGGSVINTAGVKLIVQIPCLNEVVAIGATIREIPRTIEGIDRVEVLIVDDGSRDGTVEAARQAGADHVIRHRRNRGLARAFLTGLDASLRLGADIIVNTDADNQYRAADIPKLVAPILLGTADMVVGDRQVQSIATFSPSKKLLQRFGSWVVRQASNTDVPDTTSGFRAFSRDAAMRVFVHDDYTYTLETIIQAGTDRMALSHVPVSTNPPTRPSRLIRSIPSYLRRSIGTILRVYAMYKPLRVFSFLAITTLLGGIVLGARFLFYYWMEPGRSGHVQSLILAAILTIVAFQMFLVGLVADLIAANRRLLEDVRTRVRRLEASNRKNDSSPP